MGERIELKANLGGPIGLGIVAAMSLVLALVLPTSGMIICGAIGLVLMFFAVKLGQRRLVIDEAGVTAKGMFGTSAIAWNELDHYTFWSMDQQAMYAVGGAQGGVAGVIVVAIIAAIISSRRNKGVDNRRFSMGRLTIVGQAARRIHIDNRYRKVSPALEGAFDQLHGRLHARRDYAPFTLSDQELRHATKGSLALAEIEKISVGGGRLIIKKRGKRLAWLREHMKNVHNGLLFIEELGEKGLVVDAKAGMFVPPTVLDKLRAATARQAAMPAARVVSRD
jgi:hypothetical protein